MFKTRVINKGIRPVGNPLRGFHKYVADKYREEVVNVILSQPKIWPPLSEAYKKRKARYGYDTRMLIASKQYIDSIVVYRSNTAYVVGTKPFQQHMPTKLSPGMLRMDKLAKYLEYGTKHIPARPHWRPAFLRIKRELPYLLKEFIDGRNKDRRLS